MVFQEVKVKVNIQKFVGNVKAKFQNRSRKDVYLAVGVLFGILSLFLIIYSYIPGIVRYRINKCTFNVSYPCYVEQVKLISSREGVGPAIEYVKIAVLPKWGFGLTHMVLHVVGEEAVYKYGDVEKSLTIIKPYISEKDINEDGFDGYLHGVFRGYFKMNANLPVSDLMKQVCSEYYSSDLETIDINSHHGSKAEECFHGIGHALMYLNKNNLEKSRFDCREAPHHWMQKGCLRGVFMEQMYGYADFLAASTETKPIGDSMLELCNPLKDEDAMLCANLVGESYLLGHKRDVKGAYIQCRLLKTNEMQHTCMDRIALLSLPYYFKDDYYKIIDTCHSESGEFVGSCLYSANQGIMFGAAGSKNKEKLLCPLVEDSILRETCFNGRTN